MNSNGRRPARATPEKQRGRATVRSRTTSQAHKKRRRVLLVLLPLLLAMLWRLISPSASSAPPAATSMPTTTVSAPALSLTSADTRSPTPAATTTPAPTAMPTPTASPMAIPTPVPTSVATPTPTSAPLLEVDLPAGFAYVQDVHPDIRVELRYLGTENFMGRPADGYEANVAILTDKAVTALAKVQNALMAQGLGLIVYDAYRPERAVADFVRWGGALDDQKRKDSYYPDIPKADILGKGFLARRSSHSRGSTVDLTIIDLSTETPVDMGTPFDWFGPESDPEYAKLTAEQTQNRNLLRTLMDKEGFAISSIEWWHFRLRNEPFPETYFDFPVR